MKRLFTLFALMAFSLTIFAQSSTKRGDVNGDGAVSISDVALLVNQIVNGGNLGGNGDINGDGSVSIADVTMVVSVIIFGDNSQPQAGLCPDDHHPHMIDLGLPSGTKWACCNVGATAPEGTGGYYAWGETETKTTYDYGSYIYYDSSEDSYEDLGNIAGTRYDVAAKEWGGSWRMPNLDQFTELAGHCTFTWTTEGGVVGGKFTGKNGNSIFLPAAGGYVGSRLNYLNTYGLYWLDTPYIDLEGRAYPIIFNANTYWDEDLVLYDMGDEDFYFPREQGYQVRPAYLEVSVVNLELATADLTLEAGDVETVGITSGSGNYTAATSNAAVATAVIDGSAVKVTAVGEGAATITVTDTQSGQTATIEVTVEEATASMCPDSNHPHMIDLGLPSGTKWACCNVDPVPSKQNPTNYGGYYAWGETEAKRSFSWSNYVHCDGTYETLHDIGNDICGTEFDVAHVKWEDNWRMPSQAQRDELYSNTTYAWTTVDGIYGGLFTAANGNSIFLPAAGFYDGYGLCERSETGRYWTGTLGTGYAYNPSNFGFYDGATYVNYEYAYSMDGASIRPVSVEVTLESLTLASTTLSLTVGDEPQNVTITSGNGNYTVESSDEAVATAVIDGTSVKVTAVGAGTVTITVTDTESGETATIEVTVEEPDYPPLALSENTLTIKVGVESTVDITSGSGDYEVSSFVFNGSNGITYYGNIDDVYVIIEGSSVKFTSSIVGTGTIKIIDNNTGETATIEVTVEHALQLSERELNLDLEENFSCRVEIYGGSGEYTVESSDENVATVGIVSVYEDVGYFDVRAEGHGTATITVTDTRTGEQITLEVKVTVPLELSDTEINLYTNDCETVRIMNGSGSYIAWSSDENVATASVKYSNYVEIQSYEEGTATITVKDTETGQIGTITVIVKQPEPLILSSSSLTLEVGSMGTIEISGGSGDYLAVSHDDEVATAEVDGNSVIVTAVGAGTATITVYDIERQVSATIEVTVEAAQTGICPDGNHPHIIDLGLPSGTKWSCCNVDTEHPENQSPTNYGGYYAWGETEVKTDYSWSTYRYGSRSNPKDIGDNISGTRYDVATVKWGSDWKMPTKTQMEELINNCSYENTTINGVNGLKVTGTNGSSIFLPNAGSIEGTELKNLGDLGYYRSSMTYSNNPTDIRAYYLYNAQRVMVASYNGDERNEGMSVRPISAIVAYRPLELLANSVTLSVDDIGSVDITSGSGSYTVATTNANVATAVIDGNAVKVTAVGEGTATITVTDTNSGETATIEVTVVIPPVILCPDDNHPHIIDMGLPSGTKWACCNVGATAPEGYGDYYAWGETAVKTSYTWRTYSHYDSSSDSFDDLGGNISGTEHDVAKGLWGSNWQLPTLAQLNELRGKCVSEWTTIGDVKGYKYTASNGNSIFLPAAGVRSGSNLYFQNVEGQYWSGEFYGYQGEVPDAYILGVYEDDFTIPALPSNENYGVGLGRSVRPVYYTDDDGPGHGGGAIDDPL